MSSKHVEVNFLVLSVAALTSTQTKKQIVLDANIKLKILFSRINPV
jgi:hypothetical protein